MIKIRNFLSIICCCIHFANGNFLVEIEHNSPEGLSQLDALPGNYSESQAKNQNALGQAEHTLIDEGSSLTKDVRGNAELSELVRPFTNDSFSKENKCDHLIDLTISREITVRKCCPKSEFYSFVTNDCFSTSDSSKFTSEVQAFANVSSPLVINTFAKRLNGCETRTAEMDRQSLYDVIDDGNIYDCSLDVVYNHTEYCLEMIGQDIGSSTLVLVYCPPLANVIPKCCPRGQSFDTRIDDCTPNLFSGDQETESLLYFHEDSTLGDSDLRCVDLPVRIDMTEAFLDGSNLCLTKNGRCYNWDKYCVDNMIVEGVGEMVQAALLCPEFFIKKCCPKGESLHEGGCKEVSKQSRHLTHILENHPYHVKSISNVVPDCNPIAIEEGDKSDISWAIDSEEIARISKNNKTLYTNMFCVEDFVNNEGETVAILKVCWEEIKEFYEVSFDEVLTTEKAVGKCCGPNLIYKSEPGREPVCVERQNNVTDISEVDELRRHNISLFLNTGTPACSHPDGYHVYILGKSFTDYADITDTRSLQIVNTENNCIIRKTEIDASRFCLDMKAIDDIYRAVAVVCPPELNTVYREKGIVIVSMVALSCAALFASFFSLVTTRVRRGMVTIKKVKTLAGKIQISYVLSQLIGYAALGVSNLADFGEESSLQTRKCFIMIGFLQFFMIAAFCWNTSICLEGFLLTMNVRKADRTRYFLHSLWAWGVPGIITATTLIRDANRDRLPCDAITPKIGVGRCFGSDFTAQLLFIYLPISITVFLNGALLASGKIIRHYQLKRLEKDPHAIKRHGTIQKALSIKNIRNRLKGGEPPGPAAPSSHSGLRTHQNKNVWIESLKLVVWSGTTWLLEIIGTLVTIYIYEGRSEGEWYNYLWYISVAFNCLRGLGIFFIISVTSESQSKFARTVRSVGSGFQTTISKLMTETIRFNRSLYSKKNASSEKNKNNSTDKNTNNFRKSKNVTFRNGTGKDHEESRRISVSTIITNVSGLTTAPNNETTGQEPPNYYHSISQSDYVRGAIPLPVVQESSELACPDDLSGVSYKDPETSSLDNSSMETAFWEHDPSLMMREGKLVQARNYSAFNVYDKTQRNKSLSKDKLPGSGISDANHFVCSKCSSVESNDAKNLQSSHSPANNDRNGLIDSVMSGAGAGRGGLTMEENCDNGDSLSDYEGTYL